DDHGDTPFRATPISPGIAVQGQMTEGDQDFFAFTAAAGERFTLEVSLIEPGHALETSILSVNGSTPLEAGEAWPDENRRYRSVSIPRAGTYFVRVAKTFISQSSDYQLLLHRDVDDHGDTAETATALASGEETLGSSDFVEDVDVFRTSIGVEERLRVSLLDIPSNGSVVVEVWDEARRLWSGGRTGAFSLTVRHPSGGELFVRVRPFFPSVRAYRLRLENLGTDDHGNALAGATVLIPGAPSLPGTLGEGDRDVFAIDALAGQIFVVKLDVQTLFPSLRVQLLDPDGVAVAPEQGRTYDVLRAGRDGRYFFSVTPPAEATFAYEIALSAPISGEPGNTLATATPVEVDGPGITVAREYPQDQDIFSFSAAAGETLLIEATGTAAGADPYLLLLAGDHSTLAQDSDSAGNRNARITFTFPASGTYFVWVYPTLAPCRLTVRRLS
ncbi:MAG TPA: PPC domain-containing protein, partial [Thermoanaerobaculia bacterium]|nr:PPC domain-containing protein [Thermoanaerobaculia bacterium]